MVQSSNAFHPNLSLKCSNGLSSESSLSNEDLSSLDQKISKKGSELHQYNAQNKQNKRQEELEIKD
jgi:hypothetical protein